MATAPSGARPCSSPSSGHLTAGSASPPQPAPPPPLPCPSRTPLATPPPAGGHASNIEADSKTPPRSPSGLPLLHDPRPPPGTLLDDEGFGVRLANGYAPSRKNKGAPRATLRIINDRQENDFYY